MGWTVLPQPPYNPNLAFSDCHLFDPLKDALKQAEHSISHKGGKSALIIHEILWKNNLNSVKDVPMTYVSEKKNRRNYFCTALILKCYYMRNPTSPYFLLS
jgi:hypothetical protein